MRFLLDVCVSSRSLESFLVASGHDVFSALAIDPPASDDQLLDMALKDDRLLITQDKDFGELVFVQQRPHGPVIRLVELSVPEQVDAMRELLNQHAADLVGPAIVTVSRGRVRIRRTV
jgi:predicted nuclease of predicted toxin-antitoxin system